MDLLEKIESRQDDLRGEVNSIKMFNVMSIICLLFLVTCLSCKGAVLVVASGLVASLVMILKCKIGICTLLPKIEKMLECYEKGQDYCE